MNKALKAHLAPHCAPIGDAEPNTDAWLELRRLAIGASDAPAILGLSPYSNARNIWLDKMGRSKKQPAWLAPYARVGHLLEEPIISHVYRDVDVVPYVGQSIPTMRSILYPWLAASLDGYDAVADCVIEVKTDSWDNAEGPPDKHVAQAQHQMIITGASSVCLIHATFPIDRVLIPELVDDHVKDCEAFLVWLVDKSKVVSHIIKADTDWQQRWIDRSRQWWTQYVEAQVEPPEVEEMDDTVILDDAEEVVKALDAYALADQQYQTSAKPLEKARDEAKKKARDAISLYAPLESDSAKRVQVGKHKATACKTRGGSHYWRLYPGEVDFDLEEF